MKNQVFLLLIVPVLCLLVSGCGSDLSGLTGTVTIDGEPAPKGLALEFVPQEEGGLQSYASTDANGRYEAAFTFKTMGIQPGEYIVRLMPSDIETSMPVIGPDGRPVSKPKENPVSKLPGEYYKEIQKFTVDSGSNTLDIELSTKN